MELWTHGTPFRAEYRIQHPEGERWILGMADPVRNAEGAVVQALGVAMDITEKKATERLLEEQQLKMITSAKLSALGEMAGGIAHEINNPLSIINGNAGLLKSLARNGIFDPGRMLELADRIENTVRRISGIVKSLRTIARGSEEEPMQPELLAQIVADTLEICSDRFAKREIRLEIDPFPSDLVLQCRAGQIAQILLNLLNNAVDAIGRLPERWIRITVTSTPALIEIAVTDSGPGIAPEIRSRILEPFFTTKPAGRGTGLGLSISKALAEKNQGDLRLDSDCANTRFVISFSRS
jgi:C4-dicarboxylate-specific signal transduction histidine kinase